MSCKGFPYITTRSHCDFANMQWTLGIITLQTNRGRVRTFMRSVAMNSVSWIMDQLTLNPDSTQCGVTLHNTSGPVDLCNLTTRFTELLVVNGNTGVCAHVTDLNCTLVIKCLASVSVHIECVGRCTVTARRVVRLNLCRFDSHDCCNKQQNTHVTQDRHGNVWIVVGEEWKQLQSRKAVGSIHTSDECWLWEYVVGEEES